MVIKTILRATSILIAANFALGSALALPVPTIDVPALARDANVIVVSRIAEHTVNSDAKTEALTLAVERVLKGPSDLRGTLIHLTLDRSKPSRSAPESDYAMFFLRELPGGQYQVINAQYPAVVAAPSAPKTAQSQSLPGVIASELTSVLATPPTMLTHDANWNLQYIYSETADAIDSIPATVTKAPLLRISKSDSLSARLWATKCLVSAGNIQQLSTVSDELVNPTTDTELVVQAIAFSIDGNAKTVTSIPVLSKLLKSHDVIVRREASSALRDIESPAVIRPLASLALNDPDKEVRYMAVYGLEEASGRKTAPSTALFDEKEKEYVDYWTKWAAQHGYLPN